MSQRYACHLDRLGPEAGLWGSLSGETQSYQAPGVRLELTTNGLTVPTPPSVWSRYVRSGAVVYGFPTLLVRPVRSGAVWYGYTYGYTTNLAIGRQVRTDLI
jgi:hypothetical protein